MFNTTPAAKLAALALVAFALAGCNKGGEPTTAAPVDAAATPAATQTPTAESGINDPIAQGEVNYTLALVGAPVYQPQDDMLVFNVAVSNSGKSPFVSSGKMPVKLGIALWGPADANGVQQRVDFGRGMLPFIAPGSTGQTQVRIPAEPLLGMTVRGDLVQEGVAWFGQAYKLPTLDVGVFQRCNGAANTLCDAAGMPVGSAAPAPAPAPTP
jgi:hypothetical protein